MNCVPCQKLSRVSVRTTHNERLHDMLTIYQYNQAEADWTTVVITGTTRETGPTLVDVVDFDLDAFVAEDDAS